ncbi:MAG: methyltransferase domain-containing protein [Oscillospiraceae bacterium]|nr:methyltransferase domain-containing protein [Oscillospiraceae bacterium]
MINFSCPVCSEILSRDNNTMKCSNGHSYDISKRGYINLLMSQKRHDRQHGDDKIMVRARRNFLENNYYSGLRQAVAQTVCELSSPGSIIFDAGCGECYYTEYIHRQLDNKKTDHSIFAVDISKNALDLSGKRCQDINRAVASVFNIPMSDNSCDILLSIFAPYCGEEFLRVLKPNGFFIQVIPLEDHLFELKKAVYERPYKNEVAKYSLDGFTFVREQQVRGKTDIGCNEDIKNLFMMTPYFYKTSTSDFHKLDQIDKMTVETEFAVLLYKKI